MHGVEYVFATVVLAGILQVIAGFLKLGKLMRLVPHPVIFGFVNGLAIIIFMSQLDQFKGAGGDWLTGGDLYTFLGLVLLTMLIIWVRILQPITGETIQCHHSANPRRQRFRLGTCRRSADNGRGITDADGAKGTQKTQRPHTQ